MAKDSTNCSGAGKGVIQMVLGAFPTGLEQSPAEDSKPKAGSGALRSSPLLTAHGNLMVIPK